MTPQLAWRNGTILPFAEMSLPVWDLGVVAGASITEMARTYRHQPFRLGEHLNRLLDSCAELGFACLYPLRELESAAVELVTANTSSLPADKDLGIVIFVTAGSNPTYLGGGDLPGPTVGIHTFPLPFELWKTAAADGVRLCIPTQRQISSECLPVHRKTRNRLHWWLADRAAQEKQPGSRALLLDQQGRITETSTSCFYAVIDNQILTPRHQTLSSMSRRIVEELAAACGIPFVESDLRVDQIRSFEEAFVSSTPSGIFRVHSIDGFPIGQPSTATVVPQLLQEWQQLTGVHPARQILE